MNLVLVADLGNVLNRISVKIARHTQRSHQVNTDFRTTIADARHSLVVERFMPRDAGRFLHCAVAAACGPRFGAPPAHADRISLCSLARNH